MDFIKVRTPAKINLALDVLGLRDDGYHEIATVMQTISIFDDIAITKRKEPGITLSSTLPFLPIDGRNLAAKAVTVFFEAAQITSGIEIMLTKRIPVGAGMAGGSANAAGVLLGLNSMFNTGYKIDELTEIGRPLGSDVAFCLRRGTFLATGKGDELTRVTDMPACTVVVAKPRRSISTPALYSSFDAHTPTRHPEIRALIASFSNGVRQMASNMYNILEPVATVEVPQIADMINDLKEGGAAAAIMTGSGSAVFGVFTKSSQAAQCTLAMRQKHEKCFILQANPIRE